VLTAFIEHVVSEQMPFVVRESYKHNNGFHKLVLYESPLGHRVRLHVFDPGLCVEEGVHDHRWSFCSTILSGTLTQDILQDANPESATEVHDEYTYVGFPQVPTYVGRTPLRVVEKVTYCKGTTYAMDTKTLHRITQCASDATTITLVITSPPTRASCRLFNSQPAPIPQAYDATQLRALLHGIVDMLKPS
jgi:hypothetical protein